MKIKDTCSWYPREQPEHVEDYASRCLTGDGDGQLEDLESGQRKIRAAFGRLLDTLAAKGLLSAPEIVAIVDGYPQPNAKLEP